MEIIYFEAFWNLVESKFSPLIQSVFPSNLTFQQLTDQQTLKTNLLVKLLNLIVK